MQISKLLTAAAALLLNGFAYAEDGRHCQEHMSAACPFATFFSAATGQLKTTTIMQGLRDAMYYTTKSDSTTYKEGDHIICIGTSLTLNIPILGRLVPLTLSGGIPYGGICVFAEHLKGGSITLEQAKKLADALLNNKCYTCGIIPVGWPSDTNDNNAILKFDFVTSPTCTGNCITSNDVVNAGQSAVTVTAAPTATATVQSVKTVTQTTATQPLTSVIYQTVTRTSGSSPTSANNGGQSSTAVAAFTQNTIGTANKLTGFSALALFLQVILMALMEG